MLKFANVIVDISHEKLDRMFQYIIPEDLLYIKAGNMVVVPFGKSNRSINAYVLETTYVPEYDVSKMKYIIDIVKKSMSIDNKLVALAIWIRDMYGGTLNQALKTVIPIKQKINPIKETIIYLKTDDNTSMKLLNDFSNKKNMSARKRLMEVLIKEKYIDKKTAIDKLNISNSTINSMEVMGIIEVKSTNVYRKTFNITKELNKKIVLNEKQQEIVNDICLSMDFTKLNDYYNNKRVHLIYGITGSGKTQIYMEIIENAIKKGKEAIVLIPEIALTYQMLLNFYSRFGDVISIINSKMSNGEKYDEFIKAKNGETKIMIGPRSALFTPFRNLGVIIIDEEHEDSYKSETVPRYHARETAIEIARLNGALVVLGSATPSINAYYKAINNEYILHKLEKKAINNNPLNIKVIDLREELKNGNKSIFSRELKELIRDRLNKKEQIMIFINRRGYANFVSCRMCGEVIKCPHCDVSLKYHKDNKLRCHYCGYEIEMPKVCPSCGSKYISPFGTGTQKVEELLKKEFKNVRILRMDMDTTKKKNSSQNMLETFSNNDADILVGTQMIVKGHDFPNVTLVGIIAADLSLYASSYTASEKTFQLLTQASGRAGRGQKKGDVIIQTYSPEHYSIDLARKQDYEGFFEKEISYRKLMHYPPVSGLMVILILGLDENNCDMCSKNITLEIKKYFAKDIKSIVVIGPTDASVSKINDIYRKIIFIKSNDYEKFNVSRNIAESNSQKFKDVNVQFDVQ